jgi:hypothetical protein
MTAPEREVRKQDSPWLKGWKSIGAWIGMDASTVAKKARIRRAVSWVDRHPRITKQKLDEIVSKATK